LEVDGLLWAQPDAFAQSWIGHIAHAACLGEALAEDGEISVHALNP
jgi:hypothetical protein